MGYTKTIWNDDNIPFIDARHLNHMEDGILNAVCKDGDTMVGKLILNGNTPIDENEAVTKSYVEQYINEKLSEVTIDDTVKRLPVFR